MISEQKLKEMEALDLKEKIQRIEALLKDKVSPRPFELGILLALNMAYEIQQGKALGENSASIVSSWSEQYPASIVEEAIAQAKEFLLHSGTLMEKIRNGLLESGEISPNA